MADDRLLQVALILEGIAQVIAGFKVIGAETHSELILEDGLFQPA